MNKITISNTSIKSLINDIKDNANLLHKNIINGNIKESMETINHCPLSAIFPIPFYIEEQNDDVNNKLNNILKIQLIHRASCIEKGVDVLNLVFDRNISDVDCLSDWGTTRLQFAAQKGILNNVEYLIQKGANINFTSKKNDSVICYAIQSKNINIIKMLLNNKSIITHKDIMESANLEFSQILIDLLKYYDKILDELKFDDKTYIKIIKNILKLI